MHPLKAVGPALATSLASAFNAAVLGFILHRHGHFALDTHAKRRLPRILLAAAIMAAALAITERLLPAGKTNILDFVILTSAGGIAYLGSGILLNAFDLTELRALATRRKAKIAR
jgi:putative peptidoglycan lipid II flippase